MSEWKKNPDGTYSMDFKIPAANAGLLRGLSVSFPDKPAGMSDEQWIRHMEYMGKTYPDGIPEGVRVGTIFNITPEQLDPPRVEGKP